MPLDMTRLSNLQVYFKDNKAILESIAKIKTNAELLETESIIKQIYNVDLPTNPSSTTLSKSKITPRVIWDSNQPINYPLNMSVETTIYDPSIGDGRGRGNKASGQGQGQRQGSGQGSSQVQGQRQRGGGGRKEQLLINILTEIQNNSKSNEEKLSRLLEIICTPYIIKGRLYLLIDTNLLEKFPNLIKILSILQTTLYIDTIKDIPIRLTMDKELYDKLVSFQTECNKYLVQIPLAGGKPTKKHKITIRNKKQKIHKKTKKQQKTKRRRISKKRWNHKNPRKSRNI